MEIMLVKKSDLTRVRFNLLIYMKKENHLKLIPLCILIKSTLNMYISNRNIYTLKCI